MYDYRQSWTVAKSKKKEKKYEMNCKRLRYAAQIASEIDFLSRRSIYLLNFIIDMNEKETTPMIARGQ